MKTRIIYTKFWEDNYITDLSIEERILFIYLLTNRFVGLSNIYELQDRRISFDTGIPDKELQRIKSKFQKDKKFCFIDGYIGIVNSDKYNQYTGEKNELAKIREFKLMNQDTLTKFKDTLSIPYLRVRDTPINHKSEIRNKKPKILNKKSGIKNKKSEDTYKKNREKLESIKKSNGGMDDLPF